MNANVSADPYGQWMGSQYAFNNAGLSAENAKSTWAALRTAIRQIQVGDASTLRFEHLYRNAYTLVLHQYGAMLYKGVRQCIAQQLTKTRELLQKTQGDELLPVLVEQWDQHKLNMTMFRDIFMYMDKNYSLQEEQPVVYDMGMQLFRDRVVLHAGMKVRIQQLMLLTVHTDRAGEPVDLVLLKNCVGVLVEVHATSLSVYHEVFEKEFLVTTRNFYRQESQRFINENTCTEYLVKAEAWLAYEEQHADLCLDPSTKAKLKAVLNRELISAYVARLVQDQKTGCIAMFRNNQLADLKRTYQLLSRVPDALSTLLECMQQLVKQVGRDIVTDKENLRKPKLFVRHVLDTRTKFHHIVVRAFNRNLAFVKALKIALEYFINLDQRAAQFLTMFVDDTLRQRTMPEQEMEATLSSVILIFQYLHDKDVFEDFYKRHLCTRLLEGVAASMDAEKSMILKLKAECGPQFTSRLEGMIKDMQRSEELMAKYRHTGSILSVQVLTTGFWPVPSPLTPVILPSVAARECAAFVKYYSGAHSGRRLMWHPNMGTAEVNAEFATGKKELVMHTYQMVVLMLFNNEDTLTFKEIQDQTNISPRELTRHLLSLAHPKVRILLKKPLTKAVGPDHKFTFNHKYTSRLFRVKVPLLTAKAAGLLPTGLTMLPAAVLEARKNRVEAALVRVMKSRKSLDHNNLVTEVVKQLSSRFTVEPGFIKTRIESLIDRDYFERDPQNRRKYIYLA